MSPDAAPASLSPAGGSAPARSRRPPAKLACLEAEVLQQRAAIDALTSEVAELRAEKLELLAQLYEARSPAGDGSMDPVELVVPVGPQAPSTARGAVTRWLTGRVGEAVLDNARLLVSELVTNSVQHGQLAADAPVRISLHLSGGVLRLEVRDPGHAGSVVPHGAEPGGGGYGFHLVRLLATRWGVDRAAGTRVWVELAAAS
jgi:serine/threonine-protein kinase RsbW